jgi:tripartite-type tricarboxylate transporter receptor subunit TctC
MKTPIVVENRPGAGLIAGTEPCAKAPADGYTMCLTGVGSALNVSLFKSLPFDIVEDFRHLSTIAFLDIAMVTSVDSNFNSVADVLAYAKANPGKMNIATINIGSGQHLSAELFKSMAGVNVQIVPFKGTPAVVTALRSKDVDIAFEYIAPVVSQIRGKTLKPLAIASSRRLSEFPSTPTLHESGITGYEANAWNGFSITAKTPPPIVERLNKEIVGAVNSSDVRDKMGQLGAQARSSTPEEMRELMVKDIAKWKSVIERSNIERQ